MSGRTRSGTASRRYPVAGCPAISTPSSRNCCTSRQTSDRLVPISSAIFVPLTTTMELSARRRTMCPRRASVRAPGSSAGWLRGFMRAGENYPARRGPRQAKVTLLLCGFDIELDLDFFADRGAAGIVVDVVIEPVDGQTAINTQLFLTTGFPLSEGERNLNLLGNVLNREIAYGYVVLASSLYFRALEFQVRILFDLEKVVAAKILVAVFIVGIDGRGLDVGHHAGFCDVLWIEMDGASDSPGEATANGRDEQVLDCEVRGRVVGIDTEILRERRNSEDGDRQE